MDQGGFGSNSHGYVEAIDKSRVLDVKPLRRLVPVLPNLPDMSSTIAPHPSNFVCVTPSGPFPPGVQPFFPFLGKNEPQCTYEGSIPAPVSMNTFITPRSQAKRGVSQSRKVFKADGPEAVGDDGYGDTQDQNDPYVSGFSMEDASNSGKKRGWPKKPGAKNDEEASLVNNFRTLYRLHEMNAARRSSGDKDIVDTILLVFDLIRRRLTQLEEVRDLTPRSAKRSYLRATTLLMSTGVRTNSMKRIGHVPGIDVGDIFYFRAELCIVGLHAQTMGGIDYMSVKVTENEEPLAISIVSAGGYDDEGDDSNMLIYTGHGGVKRKDGLMFDQKLERGNLALEKSLHRGNEVRVIRGVKDIIGSPGKIYIYDGLYKIQESWAENKSGCNVFKYKLARLPGQPESFSLWKSIQQWKDGAIARSGIILADLSSGAESQPIALVNEVDDERELVPFTYIPKLKYSQPFSASDPCVGCQCPRGCQPKDTGCPCNQKNDGFLPYASIGVLLTNKTVIHECGLNCACPANCRSRMSQAGIKLRLEVFRTKDRGWAVRSWDPIRAGAFICEYAGNIIKLENGNDDNYIFDATRHYPSLEPVNDPSVKAPYPLVISAKHNGNVARFMNHSCSPNLHWQPVLRESNNDSAYLHIAFFAIRHIPPLQELTYDYGMVPPGKEEEGRKRCLCRSEKCRGYFY